jgi:hypothetical protein
MGVSMMGRVRMVVVLVVVAVVAGFVTPADAAPVLCQKKSGVIVVREAACKKNKEKPLDLAQFGAVGPKGDKGDPGPLFDTLPSGHTLRGVYALYDTGTGAGTTTEQGISFQPPLASAPVPHFIGYGTTPPPECPGTAVTPEAAPGHLCVYEASTANVAGRCIYDALVGSCGTASVRGVALHVSAGGAGFYASSGSWAVMAP